MKVDVSPLIQYLADPTDVAHGRLVIMWLYNYKEELLRNAPMMALTINDRYTKKYLDCDYPHMDLDTALEKFIDASHLIQEEILATLHTLVDLLIIYTGEGPFSVSEWKDRITEYERQIS